ncbi:af4/fmr2 family member [Anaeramoeba ignava]|uniref:Af4/fmr2 family member n=1 Tax=Anaeramoeba ignava TaxID=1746090 RepID=A0A9Q0LIM5_ANAIG|nr:af4/fmr2 family member [Anaeramoeba ignava]
MSLTNYFPSNQQESKPVYAILSILHEMSVPKVDPLPKTIRTLEFENKVKANRKRQTPPQKTQFENNQEFETEIKMPRIEQSNDKYPSPNSVPTKDSPQELFIQTNPKKNDLNSTKESAIMKKKENKENSNENKNQIKNQLENQPQIQNSIRQNSRQNSPQPNVRKLRLQDYQQRRKEKQNEIHNDSERDSIRSVESSPFLHQSPFVSSLLTSPNFHEESKNFEQIADGLFQKGRELKHKGNKIENKKEQFEVFFRSGIMFMEGGEYYELESKNSEARIKATTSYKQTSGFLNYCATSFADLHNFDLASLGFLCIAIIEMRLFQLNRVQSLQTNKKALQYLPNRTLNLEDQKEFHANMSHIFRSYDAWDHFEKYKQKSGRRDLDFSINLHKAMPHDVIDFLKTEFLLEFHSSFFFDSLFFFFLSLCFFLFCF